MDKVYDHRVKVAPDVYFSKPLGAFELMHGIKMMEIELQDLVTINRVWKPQEESKSPSKKSKKGSNLNDSMLSAASRGSKASKMSRSLKSKKPPRITIKSDSGSSPTKAQKPAKKMKRKKGYFCKSLLRKFDKLQGNFKDKEFGMADSQQKTEIFLRNQASDYQVKKEIKLWPHMSNSQEQPS